MNIYLMQFSLNRVDLNLFGSEMIFFLREKWNDLCGMFYYRTNFYKT